MGEPAFDEAKVDELTGQAFDLLSPADRREIYINTCRVAPCLTSGFIHTPNSVSLKPAAGHFAPAIS